MYNSCIWKFNISYWLAHDEKFMQIYSLCILLVSLPWNWITYCHFPFQFPLFSFSATLVLLTPFRILPHLPTWMYSHNFRYIAAMSHKKRLYCLNNSTIKHSLSIDGMNRRHEHSNSNEYQQHQIHTKALPPKSQDNDLLILLFCICNQLHKSNLIAQTNFDLESLFSILFIHLNGMQLATMKNEATEHENQITDQYSFFLLAKWHAYN